MVPYETGLVEHSSAAAGSGGAPKPGRSRTGTRASGALAHPPHPVLREHLRWAGTFPGATCSTETKQTGPPLAYSPCRATVGRDNRQAKITVGVEETMGTAGGGGGGEG